MSDRTGNVTDISPVRAAREQDRARMLALEKELDELKHKIANVRAALVDRRYGDALALTRPSTLPAPPAGSGGVA